MTNGPTSLDEAVQQAAKFAKDITLGTDNVQRYREQLDQLERLRVEFMELAQAWDQARSGVSIFFDMGTDGWHGRTRDESDEIMRRYYTEMSKFEHLNIVNNGKAIARKKIELEQKISEEEGVIAKLQNMLADTQKFIEAGEPLL